MARMKRYFLPDQPQLVLHRGLGGQAVFLDTADYRKFHADLADTAAQYACAVHAYVLMPDHVHLLATPADARSLPGMMQALGRRYARAFNARHGRSGALWQGRYRATVVQAERHLLDCARYIELNPVRAGLGGLPSTYRWSSYGANASGRTDPVVTPHPLYDALDDSPIRRRSTYWKLFAQPFDQDLLARIRACTEGGWALGDDDFRRRVEATAGRRATLRPRGRPKGSGKKPAP